MTREEAIKYFENGINTNLHLKEKDKFAVGIANENIEAYSMAISALSENKGEWIPKERQTTDFGLYIDIVCSECGYVGNECYAYGYELNEIDMKKVRDSMKELDMNFCPCCGAKMDKGDI